MRDHTKWWLAAVLLALTLASPHARAQEEAEDEPSTPQERATRRLLEQLTDLGLFSGVVACSATASDEPYQDALGTASYELGVPMNSALRMPAGAVTQLMLSVALHQLEAVGLLNMSDPAADYLDPTDLGVDVPWCPRVYGAAAGTPCEVPTLHHLLTHSSGLWDSLRCMSEEAAEGYESWQLPYCQSARAVNYSWIAAEVAGDTPASHVLARWTLGQPLVARPGERYSYSPDGYWLLTHILEKVANTSLGEYLDSEVFAPAGLDNTFYDLALMGGGQGFHESTVFNAGYESVFDVAAGSNGTLVFTGRITATSEGLYSGLPSLQLGAGAVMSTVGDLHAFFRMLFGQPEALGLTPEALEALTTPYVQISGPNYQARGLEVNINASSYFSSGSQLSWTAFPATKLAAGGADESPVCALVSNLSPRLAFQDDASQAAFSTQCAGVPATAEVLAELAESEPTPVADMNDEERQAAFLSHLCYMVFYDSLGLPASAYVRDAVEAGIWGARSDDLVALGAAATSLADAAQAVDVEAGDGGDADGGGGDGGSGGDESSSDGDDGDGGDKDKGDDGDGGDKDKGDDGDGGDKDKGDGGDGGDKDKGDGGDGGDGGDKDSKGTSKDDTKDDTSKDDEEDGGSKEEDDGDGGSSSGGGGGGDSGSDDSSKGSDSTDDGGDGGDSSDNSDSGNGGDGASSDSEAPADEGSSDTGGATDGSDGEGTTEDGTTTDGGDGTTADGTTEEGPPPDDGTTADDTAAEEGNPDAAGDEGAASGYTTDGSDGSDAGLSEGSSDGTAEGDTATNGAVTKLQQTADQQGRL